MEADKKQKKKKKKRRRREDNPEARMTFTEHLGELRDRVIYSGVALIVSFGVCYGFREWVFDKVSGPLLDVEGVDWLTLTPVEGFITQLKLAAYAGMVLAAPFIVYQICAFIFPGLKPKERRVIGILLAGGTFLIAAGVSVAYFGTLPLVLPFLMSMNPEGVVPMLRMSETISLLIKFYGAFAVAFQFPMFILVLVYLDLLSPATLKAYRRFAIVGICVASAMFTPPEPISMIMMGLPLVVLYEGSIWLATFIVWRRNRAERRAEKKRKKKAAKSGEAPPDTADSVESETKQLTHDPAETDEPPESAQDGEEMENTD